MDGNEEENGLASHKQVEKQLGGMSYSPLTSSSALIHVLRS